MKKSERQNRFFLESNRLPEIFDSEKKKLNKNLKVANKLLKHARIAVTATPKYNIPVSREIQIVNKWKTLLHADRELAQVRKVYQVL